jgi:hypothetical protein
MRWAVPLAIFWLLVALCLYRPWDAHPLPVRDFGGIIARLSGAESARAGYSDLVAAYAQEGRHQPVFMATLAVQWTAFRSATRGWQVARFALMAAVTLLAVLCVLRFGASLGAAIAATCLWFVVAGGHEAWYLLQIAEPVAALFLCAAVLLASYWQASRTQVLLGAAIAGSLICAIWAKETMIAAIPFVWAVAVCLRDGIWVRPSLSRSVAAFTALIVVASLAALVPILLVRQAAPAAAYASQFDLAAITPRQLWHAARAAVLPVTRNALFPANLAVVCLLVWGWYVRVRRLGWHCMLSASVVMLFPLGGIALYSAWPAFPGYYAMPFALSLATIFALALTSLMREGVRARAAAVVGVVLIAAYGTVMAWNNAETDRASRRTDMAAVNMLRRVSDSEEVLVGVRDPATSGGVAKSLVLYTRALYPAVPPLATRDIACTDALSGVGTDPAAVLVLFSHLCGSIARTMEPTAHSSVRFLTVDWMTFVPRWETMAVGLWFPPSRHRPLTTFLGDDRRL